MHPSPDFLGIGTQKAGTTWLFRSLSKLPEFDLPPIKEFHYFDRSEAYETPNQLTTTYVRDRLRERGWLVHSLQRIFKAAVKQKDWKKARFLAKLYFSNYSDRWYLSNFSGKKGLTGEITPSYACLELEDIQRMYQLMPEVRLIVMLRNPIERFWSAYRFSTRKIPGFNQHTHTSEMMIDWLQNRIQRNDCSYLSMLERYARVFPKERILIGFYDAIVDQPDQLLNQVYQFIAGTDRSLSPQRIIKGRVNKSRPLACPEPVQAFLRDQLKEEMEQLAQLLGGYAVQWYHNTFHPDNAYAGGIPQATMCYSQVKVPATVTTQVFE